jgi:hypothetical protein
MSFAFFPFHLFKVLPRDMHLCRSSSNVPHLPTLFKLPQNPHFFLRTFGKVQTPLRRPRKTTSERPKVLQTHHFFYTFDLEICFGPQRHAVFEHFIFQKCSENGVLSTFLLRNVLPATTACTFSTSQRQLPKAP